MTPDGEVTIRVEDDDGNMLERTFSVPDQTILHSAAWYDALVNQVDAEFLELFG